MDFALCIVDVLDLISGLKDLRQYLPLQPIKSLWICFAAACLNMSEEASESPAQWSVLLTPLHPQLHSRQVCVCIVWMYMFLSPFFSTEFTEYWVFMLCISLLTRSDFFDHLSWGVTSVDYVSGPQGQILGGLGPEQVSLNAETCAGPSGKEQLRARVRWPPVRARVDQTGWTHTQKLSHSIGKGQDIFGHYNNESIVFCFTFLTAECSWQTVYHILTNVSEKLLPRTVC